MVNTGTTQMRWQPGTYSDVHEVPVGGMTIIGAVLAHRGYPGSVLEGETLDRYGLKELGQCLILGEVGLEEEIRDRAL